MSGVRSTGNDVFFGANGTGNLSFIAGSGNDIMGMGQGTNYVGLGTGNSAVFAATGTTGTTSIRGGGGSASIACGGASVVIGVNEGAPLENYTIFNFRTHVDHIRFAGEGSTFVISQLANQTTSNGSTTVTLVDKTTLTFVGMTHVDFGTVV